MNFLWDGLREAVELLAELNPELMDILGVTLRMAVLSTLIALAFGLPVGLALGLGRFRGRGTGMVAVNAGLGLPPVVVGLIVALLMFRGAPLGGLELIYTVDGIIVAQALLSFPIVAAFTATAVQAVPAPLFAQARALGAARWQISELALREARVGIIAAVIAALGSALSEVGAVVLVGGNIYGQTQTLASAVLTKVAAGEYGPAIAIGILLLGLILVLTAVLTLLQQRGSRFAGWRAS